jgi:hypothetical protein
VISSNLALFSNGTPEGIFGRMTSLGWLQGVSSHSRFCQVNTTIWSHSKRICISAVIVVCRCPWIWKQWNRNRSVKCRLLKDDHYYLRTKQLPVWYLTFGSVQHEVPFELMSLSMAEKLRFRKSVLSYHWNIFDQVGLKGHVCSLWHIWRCARGSEVTQTSLWSELWRSYKLRLENLI